MDFANLDIDYGKLGKRLKERRVDKQLTQERVANMAGISLNYYQRIESNNAKLSLVSLVRLSQVLEISIDYLLSDTITLQDNELINLKSLSEIEQKFIIKTIKSLKELELELINKIE